MIFIFQMYMKWWPPLVNAFLHRLFLDHDIIFYFLDIEKNQENFKSSFENFGKYYGK